MIGGQVVDVANEGRKISKDVLDFIYELKTSALIESAMCIGAILAGASDAEVKAMENVAKNVGIAFQIQDDILDVTSSIDVLGKPIMSDEKNDKTTYVTLVGLEKAKEYVEAISMEAVQNLEPYASKNVFLKELILSLIHRVK
jgi:geranylgeranyl diphosphate synthase type II